VHFILSWKGKFRPFIGNFSDTNKPTILRISRKPQIKLHNNVILILSRVLHKLTNKEINVILLLQQHWLSNELQAWLRFQQVGLKS